MADDRNRVSVTLSDTEYAQVLGVAQMLDMKPTRVVYECLQFGLTEFMNHKRKQQSAILLAGRLADQEKESLKASVDAKKPARKSKTFNQRKLDARQKKKSR